MRCVKRRGRRVAWARHFAPRVWAASIFAHVAMRPDKARPLLPVIRRFPGLLTLGARLSGKTTQVVAAA
jgi:menaquinone-9 beta-reductase